MELMIRLAEPEDSANLLALLRQLAQESDTFCITQDLDTVDAITEAQNITAIQQTTNNLMLVVADEANHLYGIATATALLDDPKVAEVGVAVLKAYQGYGLAQGLVAELIDWGVTYSTVNQLGLVVQKRNAAAIHIYEKLGFSVAPNAQQDEQTTAWPIQTMQLDVTEGD
ncbi:GNAT family N-acetyltransferase [Weissella viridescens]|uniref:GNAT family N-acetyltransferase n=1 Tax=Weissella viridescens TaxID=1629 RepID=A0A3P2RFD8_WEIVI|nr:GNAT family N-acetyltransferase [Weissella viridescens]RRG17510.1 GNAT family N-acetyltransferase [Weissella viridescens]